MTAAKRAVASSERGDRDARIDAPGAVPIVSLTPPRRRKPTWVVLGVVLVGLAALLGAYVFQATTEQRTVLVAAADIPPGEPIGSDDLRVVEVGAANQLRAIEPDQQELIIGLVPRAMIPAGTLLNTDMFIASTEAIPDGYVVVGGSFEAGAVPTADLAAGDRVQLVAVGDGVGDAATAATDLGEAEVWALVGSAAPDAVSGSDGVWVSLMLPAESKLPVAQAAADGRLRLVLVEAA